MSAANDPLTRLAQPLLFRLDPERAHTLAVQGMALSAPALARLARLRVRDPLLAQRIWGIRFPNPVGLGAGYDKWGMAIPGWHALGFGFVEIGTVTAHGQEGNPRPRLFRLPADRAVINRMGFNNDGAVKTAQRLAEVDRTGHLHRVPLGVNIGKSKITPVEEAVGDYVASLDRLWPYADYVVVNVSSPNTPGLRELQESSALAGILEALMDLNRLKADITRRRPRPILVKVAPELTDAQLDAVVDLVGAVGADGLIVCNTTLSRSGLRSDPSLVTEQGGLSGAPLAARSMAMLRHVVARSPGLPVVSVGGIATADDVWDRLAAGARLVQIWTAMVYGGPRTVATINRGLVDRMRREGVSGIEELIGSASR
jgi:dihydroorotate dehydrogenase